MLHRQLVAAGAQSFLITAIALNGKRKTDKLDARALCFRLSRWAAHIGLVATSAEVNAFYEAAMAAGATDNGKPGTRLYYDPRYYAANVFDPDGYSLEAVYKSWQHRQS